ncbi:DUF4241 domain-containing protein [Streptomyces sp. NPDC050804]|uniref:DUF4241 domain-containing protein n=1 Tax=Streptomyces sp. NPDC050804 TaxID=3154745 RepID=UPI003448C795
MTEVRSDVLVEAFYGDGWDSSKRSTVRPISREEAARRDAAGEPYAVVLAALGQELPVAVLHVAWTEHYLGIWRFDSLGRRVFEADLRRLEPGWLFLRHLAEWRYEQQDLPDLPDLPDLADETWKRTIDLYPDGKNSQGLYPRGRLGGSTHTLVDLPRDLWWLPVPEFGCWESLLTAPQFGSRGTFKLVEETSDIALRPTTGAAEPFGWRPPVPAAAPWPDELFSPGSRFAHRHRSEPLTIEQVRTVTDIALPTGQLSVCDPSYLPNGAERDTLVIEVPPGVYPVQETGASYEDEMFGDRFTVRDTYATRLLVSEKRTANWTMAVPPGEDVRLLRDGEYFGFGVDSATGCFVDSTARTELGGRYMRALTSGGGEDVHDTDEGYIKVTDDATGAELVTFMLGGDGVHPVWVGRDDTGEVTAVVVADRFEVGYLEPLTP